MYITTGLTLLLNVLVSHALPAEQPLPLKGDNGEMGGIFGIGASIISNPPPLSIMTGLITPGSESPKGTGIGPTTTGSGPYPAKVLEDPSLPNHTVYVPKDAPKGIKMPVLVFGNGGCVNVGT